MDQGLFATAIEEDEMESMSSSDDNKSYEEADKDEEVLMSISKYLEKHDININNTEEIY